MNKSLGWIRVCAIAPDVKPADVYYNLKNIEKEIINKSNQDLDIILFPEMSLTGYTCADLFFQHSLLDSAKHALLMLSEFSKDFNSAISVGLPIVYESRLFNCAAFIYKGQILGIVPKTYIPNYNEFYEKRWFTPASVLKGKNGIVEIGDLQIPFGSNLIFEISGVKYGVEICEDLWVPVPPSAFLCMAGADIVLNLSASNEQAGKNNYLVELIRHQSAKCRCGYVYASAGKGESSTDLAFAGNCIIAENGTILAESPRFEMDAKSVIADIDVQAIRTDRMKFSTFFDGSNNNDYTIIPSPAENSDENTESSSQIYRYVSPTPFTDGSEEKFKERCDEITNIQVWGLAQRLNAIGCKNAVIGISGGLDSTLALLVTVAAFDKLSLDRKGIIAVTMPGFGTTSRTHSNATELMTLLGVTILEIPIADAVNQHFKDINHSRDILDATYENSQARERTQILMDLANKYNGIVIGTGDLSELALGWCTYNGDHMSMYGVNASVPKTLVKFLVNGFAQSSDNPIVREVLEDIIDTPISPELLPASNDDKILQKTEDLVGPYILHDFFIYYMLRYSFSPKKIFELAKIAFKDTFSKEVILKWLYTFYRRFFSQQFKRSCMPDGVKVGSVCLSPRGDWRMPSDASSQLWLDEVAKLK